MSGGIKLRLAAFVLAIACMVGLIAFAAQSAWRRSGELRENLTAVQLKSFEIASHLQQLILELNNSVLRYGAYHDTNDWRHFTRTSKELDDWIDTERPNLNTEKEVHYLDLVNTNYDFYMEAARAIEAKIRLSGAPASLADFADFEKKSQHLLSLSFKLASAHDESMNSFLADSKKSLNYLRLLLVTSLGLLLLAGGGLAVVVYRELIAPLRIKLVENQALIERQEKLASLGMLAAGVAHEIRNPLTAIKAWLFIQQKHFSPGSTEEADAAIIAGELNRLERIVRDVLLFARPSEPHLARVEAAEPLRQVQALLGVELEKSRIQLIREDGVTAAIRVDPQQLQQVLINVIQNAADSIGHDGTVTLRARAELKRIGEKMVDVVVLEVVDTGKGMTPEVEKRLFDPFFTTKESGTGLGLSIAARILEKHGGSLRYQTQVNRGTTFGIVLPKA
jgi:signal transduction histidine kinase